MCLSHYRKPGFFPGTDQARPGESRSASFRQPPPLGLQISLSQFSTHQTTHGYHRHRTQVTAHLSPTDRQKAPLGVRHDGICHLSHGRLTSDQGAVADGCPNVTNRAITLQGRDGWGICPCSLNLTSTFTLAYQPQRQHQGLCRVGLVATRPQGPQRSRAIGA